MATIYRCDHCGGMGDALTGWAIVSVQFMHMDPNASMGGRTLDATAPDLLFDKPECRDAWCAQAKVEPPPATPPARNA